MTLRKIVCDPGTAMNLLREGQERYPGKWFTHSIITAQCAASIAEATEDMDRDTAYVMGLLHDIGRRYGKSQMKHIADGCAFMMRLGYEDIARICLTHSFPCHRMDDYVGAVDIPFEQYQQLEQMIRSIAYDDYDLLIQLCDSIAGTEKVLTIEERAADIRRRYGSYPVHKLPAIYARKEYFEKKTGRPLKDLLKDADCF